MTYKANNLTAGLAFIFLIFGAASLALAQNSAMDKVIYRGAQNIPEIALTFDADATPQSAAWFDWGIYNLLNGAGIPATVFATGIWLQKHPKEAKMMAQNPLFEIANHSYSHPHLTEITPEEIKNEAEKTQIILKNLTGKENFYFRPPYGEIDEASAKAVEEQGLKIVKYDVVSGDPDKNISALRMARVVSQRAKNGSIIVFHINGRGWHTSEALPQIIKNLKRRGFKFVTVEKLLE